MLQDIAFGRLENEFRDIPPMEEDLVLCFRSGGILLRRGQDDSLTLPSWQQVVPHTEKWSSWREKQLRYLFRMEEQNYFLWMGESGEQVPEGYAYEPARPLRQLTSKDVCYAVMTGWHLYNWYRVNRFCGNLKIYPLLQNL